MFERSAMNEPGPPPSVLEVLQGRPAGQVPPLRDPVELRALFRLGAGRQLQIAENLQHLDGRWLRIQMCQPTPQINVSR